MYMLPGKCFFLNKSFLVTVQWAYNSDLITQFYRPA
jgi:hypothetical protein